MVDAQTWFEEKYKDNKNTTQIVAGKETRLEGELKIDGYSDLVFISLNQTKGITKLNITNCSKVEIISVWGNKITEILGLEGLKNLKELNISENQLKKIDIRNNSALEVLYFRNNPGLEFIPDFETLINLPGLVIWNSAGTFPIANILKKLSEGDLKEIADKLGVKTEEGKSKDDIKKEIIAEIEKNNQNKEKLKDPDTGMPDLLNDKGEIDKDKLEKFRNDAKKYQDLVGEPKNDPIKSADKKDIDQAELTKLLEKAGKVEKLEELLNKAGINPTDPNAEKQAEDLKNIKESVDKLGLDSTTDVGKQIADLKEKSIRLEIIVKGMYGENYAERWEMKIEIPTNK